jgi:hypothetical protein
MGALDITKGGAGSLALTAREKWLEKGYLWRVNLPKVTITSGASNGISFITPAADIATCYLMGVSLSKVTGGLSVQFREGDTLTAGGAGTPRNLNRAWSANPDTGCLLTGVTISFTASAGGLFFLETTLGGTAQGTRQPGPVTPDNLVKLAPSTRYSLLITADTANTPTTAGIDVAVIPPKG